MNKSCLLLLALLPLSAHADSDDLRRLSEENGRVQQQYRESGWLDGGTPAGDIENDDAYIRIGGQIYTVGNNTEELEETARLIFTLGNREIRYLTTDEVDELR